MFLAMVTFSHNESHLFKNCFCTVSECVSGHDHICSRTDLEHLLHVFLAMVTFGHN